MDFKITISVLCDQIIPRDDVSDEEEVSIRERLRFLVLAFMTGEAKSAICERQFLPGDAAESVLYDGLFAVRAPVSTLSLTTHRSAYRFYRRQAVPHLGVDDLQLAVKGLISSLPAFKSKQPTGKGSELLQLLLNGKLTASLKADLQSESKSLSPTTKALLDICEHITCVLFAAPAIDLLQFYYYSLIGKIALQRFPVDEQRWIVGHLARILSVAEKQATPQHPNLRWRVVDATPYLFEVCSLSLPFVPLIHNNNRYIKNQKFLSLNFRPYMMSSFRHASKCDLTFQSYQRLTPSVIALKRFLLGRSYQYLKSITRVQTTSKHRTKPRV